MPAGSEAESGHELVSPTFSDFGEVEGTFFGERAVREVICFTICAMCIVNFPRWQSRLL